MSKNVYKSEEALNKKSSSSIPLLKNEAKSKSFKISIPNSKIVSSKSVNKIFVEKTEEKDSEFKSLSDPHLNISKELSPDLNKSQIEIEENFEAELDWDYIEAESLKAQIDENNRKRNENSNISTIKTIEIDEIEKITKSSENLIDFEMTDDIDGNGNPVDETLKNVEKCESNLKIVEDKVPNCFINAAALFEDEYIPPIEKFTNMTNSGVRVKDETKKEEKVEKNILKSSAHSFEHESKTKDESKSKISKISTATFTRRRVPISKSVPDIVQTTLKTNDKNTEKMRNGQDFEAECSLADSSISIIGDSLEEIPKIIHDKKVDKKLKNEKFSKIPLLSDSTVGISNEKPPESWSYDFNSSIIESSKNIEKLKLANSLEKSNSSSLSYFISMDEGEVRENLELATSSINEKIESKKIFSMFVDLKKPEGEIVSKRVSHSHPPVKNYLNKSENKLKYEPMRDEMLKESKMDMRKAVMKNYGKFSGESSCELENMCNNASNRSSLHVARQDDDRSFTSSILSSMETSNLQDQDLCQGGPCLKLGMDLMRMFQEGINTDVNISVRGRFVKAHKCILASRSQYFAAILSGNWVQKSGNTIHLDEFSYNVVQFTMYHIYSGTNEIPESIDLIELGKLTDMLGLEGLREVISQTIKTRLCHNFHRPCTGCISGVIEFFPITGIYGMDDLQRKMTKWICKHFIRIWPTKGFASLGPELIEKCLNFSISHLSPENLLDIALGCDQLVSTMPSIRWTEPIFKIVNELSNACIKFISENFSKVIQSQRFLQFGKGQTWNISRIENAFTESLENVKIDEACLSHVALSRLIELGTFTIDEVEWSMIFVDFLKMLKKEIEKILMANGSKVVLSKNWELLSQDFRKKLCSTSFQTPNNANNSKTSNRKINANSRPSSSTRPSAPKNNTNNLEIEKNKTRASVSREPSDIRRGVAHNPSQITKNSNAELIKKEASKTSLQRNDSFQIQTEPLKNEVKMTKVASVSPMPVSRPVVKDQNVYTTKNVPIQIKNVIDKKTKAIIPSNSKTLLEKERSFSSRSNSGRSSSSKTTPLKPLTPTTTAAAKPFNTFTSGAKSKVLGSENEAKEKPKAQFLTNSEKAKQVSAPKLKINLRSRANSISIEKEKEVGVFKNTSLNNRPMTPSVSKRLNNVVVSTNSSTNYKPKTNSEKTIKGPNSPFVGRKNIEKKGQKNGNQMTKSSIEMDSSFSGSESQQRTLAEIGRSNTFSKDEPTVLGKLDISLTMDFN